MRIIERSVIGKISQEECEDAITVNADFVDVIDGSTSKSRQRIDERMNDGRLCMLTVSGFISTMPSGITPQLFCEGVTAAVRNVYISHGTDMERLAANPTERMAASAVVYSRQRGEVWMIGDCQCIIDGIFHDNPKPYEQRVASIRAAFIQKALANGACTDDFMVNDAGRAAAIGELIRSCGEQNKTFAVIDGFDIPFEHVRVIKISPARDSQSHEIVLASDGYPFLRSTLCESEKALARQLADDPLCINTFIATKGMMQGRKSFDDRAYIRFIT